jgi:transposase InsO family protein
VQVSLDWNGSDQLHVAVQSGAEEKAKILLAVTEDGQSTAGGGGENGGRTLHHAAMVRQLREPGSTEFGSAGKDKVETTIDVPRNLDVERCAIESRGAGAGFGHGQSGLFASLPEVTDPERLNFSAEQNAQAMKRLETIAPLLEFSSRSKRSRPTFRTVGGVAVRSMNSMVSYLANQHRVSPRTLWNWYAQYRKLGYAGLIDRVRSDKGESRFLKAHPAVRAFIENKYLGERLSVRLVHDALRRDWKSLDPEDPRPASYSAVRSYLARLPKPLLILSREGKRQFQERCEPYLLTDFESLQPNQIWVSDHGQHDAWVRNDLFSGVSANAAVRPWLTAVMDMRSRKIVGTAWSATPSSHTISSALRIGITDFGIPLVLYVDNGKDFEKIGRVDFSPECSGVLVRLGIQPQYCLPGHPQSKLIESWFGTVRKRFDCLWPSYCGSGPKERPEECTVALKEHQAFLKGKRKSSPLPLASEFVATARQWVEEYNSQHPLTGRGMKGRTPDEVFDELLLPGQRRLIESAEVLYALFWDRQRRKVSEGGCVQLHGERYEPADAESLAKLFLEIERDVIVACDPANLGEAIALDLDGRFLGRLRAQKLITRGPFSHEDIRTSMRIRRTARKAIADYRHWLVEHTNSRRRSYRSRSPAGSSRNAEGEGSAFGDFHTQAGSASGS